jgi:hypothetical protein
MAKINDKAPPWYTAPKPNVSLSDAARSIWPNLHPERPSAEAIRDAVADGRQAAFDASMKHFGFVRAGTKGPDHGRQSD